METGGRYFPYPFQWLHARFPGHCGQTGWDPVSDTTSVTWGILWSAACPFFREAQGETLWLLSIGGRLDFIRMLWGAGAPPPSLLPWWGAAALTSQSKWGVTNVYQCTQTKCQTLFLAHDPEKWRQVTWILLFLTTVANLTPISLGCHENLPWEKCSSWKASFLISSAVTSWRVIRAELVQGPGLQMWLVVWLSVLLLPLSAQQGQKNFFWREINCWLSPGMYLISSGEDSH